MKETKNQVHNFLKSLDACRSTSKKRESFLSHHSSVTTAKQHDTNRSYDRQPGQQQPSSTDKRQTPQRSFAKKSEMRFSSFSTMSPPTKERPKNATKVIYRQPTITQLPDPVRTSKRQGLSKSQSTSSFQTSSMKSLRKIIAPAVAIEIESARGVDTENEEAWQRSFATGEQRASEGISEFSDLEHIKMVLCRENQQRIGAEEQVDMLTQKLQAAKRSAEKSKTEITRMRKIIQNLKESRARNSQDLLSLKNRLLETSRLLHHALSNQVLLIQFFDKTRRILATAGNAVESMKELIEREGPRIALVVLDRDSMEQILRKNKDLFSRDQDVSEEVNPFDSRNVYPSKHKRSFSRTNSKFYNFMANSAYLNESSGNLLSCSSEELKQTLSKIEDMQEKLARKARNRHVSAPGSARQERRTSEQHISFSVNVNPPPAPAATERPETTFQRQFELMNQALCRATLEREELSAAAAERERVLEDQLASARADLQGFQTIAEQQTGILVEKEKDKILEIVSNVLEGLKDGKSLSPDQWRDFRENLGEQNFRKVQTIEERVKKSLDHERSMVVQVLQECGKQAKILENLVDTYGGLAKIAEAFATNNRAQLKLIGQELVAQLGGLQQAKANNSSELLKLKRRISQTASQQNVNTVLPYLQPHEEEEDLLSQDSDPAPLIVLKRSSTVSQQSEVDIRSEKTAKREEMWQQGDLLAMLCAQAEATEQLLK